jgi:NAD(P)-dependent dehydrogenase (short-subunit alcohol dehydrogenase family)
MARVLITGSTAGLGRAAARHLLDGGHEVVLHARNSARAGSVDVLARRAAGVVVGDLASAEEVRGVADQVNAIGGIDTVIHNAAIYVDPRRVATPEGHARTLAVNVLAPYLLTVWINGPSRLVYLSSGMHNDGDASLRDIDWTARSWNGVQAYCDSKLFITALAFAVARRWPDRRAHAVDPGWVPTRMGGPGAPDDLELGHLTQTWLAESDHPEATRSGGYWYHQRRRSPASAALDESFQDALVDELIRLTDVRLPKPSHDLKGGGPMTRWTADELEKIEAADELEIASLRSDGTLGSPRTIWVVRVDDDLYVRSVNGRASAWFRSTQRRHEGRIRAGGVEKDVAFVEADADLEARIDDAYRRKYRRYAKSIVDSTLTPHARSAALKLVPQA